MWEGREKVEGEVEKCAVCAMGEEPKDFGGEGGEGEGERVKERRHAGGRISGKSSAVNSGADTLRRIRWISA